jgi:NAD(P)-dependent dehydrogenase (short-subunit alcohol dehydrogenase family)
MNGMKNYVIVGGTSGIGLAIAKKLTNEGAHVWELSRSGREVHDMSNVTHLIWDATSDTAPEGEFPDKIDGLVYCPGTVTLKPFHRLTPADFLQDYRVNVEGAIRSIQFFLPRLKAADSPSIVLFSTVAVQMGMTFHSSISVSKGAIEGLTRALAADFAPKIRVNCIAPSLVQTPLTDRLTSSPEKIEASAKRHPLGRIGQPEDIAEAATLLLTGASWMSGQVLHIDGGMSSIRL